MPSITIRDVPEGTRAELAARAARSGRSMQEYLKATLIELAETPDRAEVLARISRRIARTGGPGLTADEIVDLVKGDRE